jgi:hypothetical protein
MTRGDEHHAESGIVGHFNDQNTGIRTVPTTMTMIDSGRPSFQ